MSCALSKAWMHFAIAARKLRLHITHTQCGADISSISKGYRYTDTGVDADADVDVEGRRTKDEGRVR